MKRMMIRTLRGAGLVGAMMLSVSLAGAPAMAEVDEWISFGPNTGSSSSGGGSWFWGGGGGKQIITLKTRYRPGTIVVSFGDRKAYYILSKTKAVSYPIAIPKKEARWSGVHRLSRKVVNPSWTPTPKMRRENPKLPPFVKGGDPRNPLGVRALYVGNTLYRLHGTDAPWLIGQEVSHGCVRFYNEDIIDLYKRAKIGALIVVTWKRFTT